MINRFLRWLFPAPEPDGAVPEPESRADKYPSQGLLEQQRQIEREQAEQKASRKKNR